MTPSKAANILGEIKSIYQTIGRLIEKEKRTRSKASSDRIWEKITDLENKASELSFAIVLCFA